MNWRDGVAAAVAPMFLIAVGLLILAGGGVLLTVASVADTRINQPSPIATAETR